MDWFLYGNGRRHERAEFLVKSLLHGIFSLIQKKTPQNRKSNNLWNQILENYIHIRWRAFQMLWVSIWEFQDFLIYLAYRFFDHF